MSLLRIMKNDEFFPSVSSFFDDIYNKDLMSNIAKGTSIPAVNISEEKESFNLEIAAPGMKKDDFKINLEGKEISISSEKKEEKEVADKKVTRKEFSFTSFYRSFRLPENVATDKILATYTDGILKVEIPKMSIPEAEKMKQIHIK